MVVKILLATMAANMIWWLYNAISFQVRLHFVLINLLLHVCIHENVAKQLLFAISKQYYHI